MALEKKKAALEKEREEKARKRQDKRNKEDRERRVLERKARGIPMSTEVKTGSNAKAKTTKDGRKYWPGPTPKKGDPDYQTYKNAVLAGKIVSRGQTFSHENEAKKRQEKKRHYRKMYYRKYRAKKKKEALEKQREEMLIAKANGTWVPKKRGTYRKRRFSFVTYEEAMAIVRYEGIESSTQYQKWYRYNMPTRMPSSPAVSYADSWTGWADFLGYENASIAEIQWSWRPYHEAMAYAQSLRNVQTKDQWVEHAKTDPNFPSDIPVRPDVVYRNNGDHWISWNVFLKKQGQMSSAQYLMDNNDALLYILKVNDQFNPNFYRVGVTIGGPSSIKDAVTKYQLQFVTAYNLDNDVDSWKNLISQYGEEHWDMPGIYELTNMSQLIFDFDSRWSRVQF